MDDQSPATTGHDPMADAKTAAETLASQGDETNPQEDTGRDQDGFPPPAAETLAPGLVGAAPRGCKTIEEAQDWCHAAEMVERATVVGVVAASGEERKSGLVYIVMVGYQGPGDEVHAAVNDAWNSIQQTGG